MLFVTVFTHIKGRVKGIEILFIQLILGYPQGLAETLEMHDFPGSQEFDGLTYIRLFYQPQDIVVGAARFLL